MNRNSGKKRRGSEDESNSKLKFFKRKQPPKDPINEFTELDLENNINDSILRSPIYTSAVVEPEEVDDNDVEMVETAASVSYKPAIVFIRPPTLNQISQFSNNYVEIQHAIDTITLYMNTLQYNIDPKNKLTAKQFFTLNENETNKLEYKDIMYSILNNNKVNRKNFYAISNMFYHYYVKLMDNLIPIAHVIVNVNYTRGKTRISHALTTFINLCAHYVVSNIKQLFNKENISNVSEEYLNVITTNQSLLTNLYNFRLSDLRRVLFIKHTTDNDINRFETLQAKNPEDRVINIHINVLYNLPRLNFE
ncbi:se96 [Alphabaculovirus alterspexiguae]|uniref:Se96 n=1 Tax=Spodoptera exigua multiple nucleopolyhedrovirus TaxID=10454 RepID=A0A3G2JU39_9ABAC|nr:se96 [Spodoptera exigua multiple nucleopolyhedrovirus]AYN45056.1 se96 [Spodoptera exigua multiple nucleopolyhedrovirus]